MNENEKNPAVTENAVAEGAVENSEVETPQQRMLRLNPNLRLFLQKTPHLKRVQKMQQLRLPRECCSSRRG